MFKLLRAQQNISRRIEANIVETAMTTSGEVVDVVIVKSTDAKLVKNKLEEYNVLDKDFRLAPSIASLSSESSPSKQQQTCIALPLSYTNDDTSHDETSLRHVINSVLYPLNIIFDFGKQFCPYSSTVLGNRNQISRSCQLLNSIGETHQQQKTLSLTLVQSGVIKAFLMFLDHSRVSTSTLHEARVNLVRQLENETRKLHLNTCPKSLQYFGDDKTIVIPLKAFDIYRDEAFRKFISFGISLIFSNIDEKYDMDDFFFVSTFFWKGLAHVFSSNRIVRRGEISPESKIRLSEYKILWTTTIHPTPLDGPGSLGWITITENGIRQSFDLTKVMFSRGNITEKIRFGTLVKSGEVVLDMYAGIGYFTLPALIHGGADHVYCCEWNEQAGKL
jgi:Met-10+ like-protein